MGITIELYRARIGGFVPQSQKCKGTVMLDICVRDQQSGNSLVISILLIMTLLLIGGIEMNPGPPKCSQQKDWKNEFSILRKEIEELRNQNNVLSKKVEYLESQNKRNNVIIYGMPENSEVDLVDVIKNEVHTKLNITLDDTDIESVKRLGKIKENDEESADETDNQGPKARPILCKFANSKTKTDVMSKIRQLVQNKKIKQVLGNTKFRDDFTDRVREIRKNLIPHMLQVREEHKREKDFKCFISYDKLNINGELYQLDFEGESLQKLK